MSRQETDFRNFQQEPDSLSRQEPEQRDLYRLLGNLVGDYIETFDEEPLPAGLRTTTISARLNYSSIDRQANAGQRLADINRVAAGDLLQ